MRTAIGGGTVSPRARIVRRSDPSDRPWTKSITTSSSPDAATTSSVETKFGCRMRPARRASPPTKATLCADFDVGDPADGWDALRTFAAAAAGADETSSRSSPRSMRFAVAKGAGNATGYAEGAYLVKSFLTTLSFARVDLDVFLDDNGGYRIATIDLSSGGQSPTYW